MAKTSEVSICNQALLWLGANRITSFMDSSVESTLCEATYPAARDAVLVDTAWTFAKKRAKLNAVTGEPLGYSYQYAIPSDCLSVIRAYRTSDMRDELDYVIEGGMLLTNNGECYLHYIFRQDDPQKYNANFVQALSYRLAADMAIPLTRNSGLQQQMTGLYQLRLSDASAVDGQQEQNQEVQINWNKPRR